MKKLLLILSVLTYTFSYADIIDIPDENFKNALIELGVDTNADSEIQVTEAEAVTSLDLSFKEIYSLVGIEHFINLETLYCKSNYISELDVSNNTLLTSLDCRDNAIEILDLNENTVLFSLNCQDNNILSLDVSATNLYSLNCSDNAISNLITNTELTYLTCNNNAITSLDLSANTVLFNLECRHNNLTSLDITATNMKWLYCGHNNITNINLNSGLFKLFAPFNNLTSIELNSELVGFNVTGNNITSLNLTDNLALESLSCNGNNLNSIDVSTNINLKYLRCGNNNISTLDVASNTNLRILAIESTNITTIDISENLNLVAFNCNNNLMDSIDVSNNINLQNFSCTNSNQTSLELSNNPILHSLSCSDNNLGTIDVGLQPSLMSLFCSNTGISNLDVSNNSALSQLKCSDNPDLNYINLNNGNNNHFWIGYSSNFENLPNLEIVCVDALDTYLTAYIIEETGHPVTFTEYCSFTPAESNEINGTITTDLYGDGCEISFLSATDILITSDNGTESFGTFTLDDGSYSLFTNEGNFATTVTSHLPDYFGTAPLSYDNTFTDFDNVFTADFCIVPLETVNDVNISVIPITSARPGFNSHYQIIYKNVGTTVMNGTVSLMFDNSKLELVASSTTVDTETDDSLSYNYTDLNPFETRIINLEFHVFEPPTVAIDDLLSFTATVNPIPGDYTEEDNTYILNQTVIGSYDPNDITCLEGEQVAIEDADKYLHYVIRFQNTGTASAINIVVKNILDEKLDWSTLQLQSTSHENRIAIINGNEIEFIFEGIELPDSTTDEPNSHGFIAYKIKPKIDIALGEFIPNKADIFFDYNEPIITNTSITTFVDVTAINENTLLNFSVYPTPTADTITIISKETINKIEIYNKLGQLVLNIKHKTKIDLSNLTQGIYYVKVIGDNDSFGVKKIIKK